MFNKAAKVTILGFPALLLQTCSKSGGRICPTHLLLGQRYCYHEMLVLTHSLLAGLGLAIAACLDGSLIAFQGSNMMQRKVQEQQPHTSKSATSKGNSIRSRHMQEVWRHKTAAPILSAPVVDCERHVCIAATVNGHINGISASTGILLP